MEMLKAAEQSPSEKSTHIQTIFTSMGFDKEPTLKAWGADVSNKLMAVGGGAGLVAAGGGCWAGGLVGSGCWAARWGWG
jgi:hypothetical protein